MNIKQQKKLYFLIKKLGIETVESLLTNYLLDEGFEFQADDEEALLYAAFNGWFNNADDNDIKITISSFIQYNLYKGAKSFEKKSKQKEKPLTDEFKAQWEAKFGVKVKE